MSYFSAEWDPLTLILDLCGAALPSPDTSDPEAVLIPWAPPSHAGGASDRGGGYDPTRHCWCRRPQLSACPYLFAPVSPPADAATKPPPVWCGGAAAVVASFFADMAAVDFGFSARDDDVIVVVENLLGPGSRVPLRGVLPLAWSLTLDAAQPKNFGGFLSLSSTAGIDAAAALTSAFQSCRKPPLWRSISLLCWDVHLQACIVQAAAGSVDAHPTFAEWSQFAEAGAFDISDSGHHHFDFERHTAGCPGSMCLTLGRMAYLRGAPWWRFGSYHGPPPRSSTLIMHLLSEKEETIDASDDRRRAFRRYRDRVASTCLSTFGVAAAEDAIPSAVTNAMMSRPGISLSIPNAVVPRECRLFIVRLALAADEWPAGHRLPVLRQLFIRHGTASSDINTLTSPEAFLPDCPALEDFVTSMLVPVAFLGPALHAPQVRSVCAVAHEPHALRVWGAMSTWAPAAACNVSTVPPLSEDPLMITAPPRPGRTRVFVAATAKIPALGRYAGPIELVIFCKPPHSNPFIAAVATTSNVAALALIATDGSAGLDIKPLAKMARLSHLSVPLEDWREAREVAGTLSACPARNLLSLSFLLLPTAIALASDMIILARSLRIAGVALSVSSNSGWSTFTPLMTQAPRGVVPSPPWEPQDVDLQLNPEGTLLGGIPASVVPLIVTRFVTSPLLPAFALRIPRREMTAEPGPHVPLAVNTLTVGHRTPDPAASAAALRSILPAVSSVNEATVVLHGLPTRQRHSPLLELFSALRVKRCRLHRLRIDFAPCSTDHTTPTKTNGASLASVLAPFLPFCRYKIARHVVVSSPEALGVAPEDRTIDLGRGVASIAIDAKLTMAPHRFLHLQVAGLKVLDLSRTNVPLSRVWPSGCKDHAAGDDGPVFPSLRHFSTRECTADASALRELTTTSFPMLHSVTLSPTDPRSVVRAHFERALQSLGDAFAPRLLCLSFDLPTQPFDFQWPDVASRLRVIRYGRLSLSDAPWQWRVPNDGRAVVCLDPRGLTPHTVGTADHVTLMVTAQTLRILTSPLPVLHSLTLIGKEFAKPVDLSTLTLPQVMSLRLVGRWTLSPVFACLPSSFPQLESLAVDNYPSDESLTTANVRDMLSKMEHLRCCSIEGMDCCPSLRPVPSPSYNEAPLADDSVESDSDTCSVSSESTLDLCEDEADIEAGCW